MKKVLIVLVVMFALSLSTTTSNKAYASENCFTFTLSCGVSGTCCPASNASIQDIVNDIQFVDSVICG